jgi:hypothetical protein
MARIGMTSLLPKVDGEAIVKRDSELSAYKWAVLWERWVCNRQLYCLGGSSFAKAFRGTVFNNAQIYQP